MPCSANDLQRPWRRPPDENICILELKIQVARMRGWLEKIRSAGKIKDLGSIEKSKTFCIMPWVHFHVTQYGTVTPCCQAPWQMEQAFGDINQQGISEIWNNQAIKDFRKTILDGKVDKRCEFCFKREKLGFTSLRQITNTKFEHQRHRAIESRDTKLNVNSAPIYFDVRFSNVCNLKCRICGPWSSSSWYNDALELNMLGKESPAITMAFKDTDKFFQELEGLIGSLEELYFAGGEPLVMEEHYRLLNLLIRHGKTNVKLTYNTNFSSFKYKSHDLIELWKQFPNISVAASLDASEKRGELLRKNLNWNQVLENRRVLLAQLPHIEFIVSPTVNAYNVLHLPEFHKDWVTKNLIQVEDFIPTLLMKPRELSISALSSDLRQKAIVQYEEHLQWILATSSVKTEKRAHMILQFKNLVQSLRNTTDQPLVEDFVRSSEAVDKLRKEETRKVFPELNELFGNLKG